MLLLDCSYVLIIATLKCCCVQPDLLMQFSGCLHFDWLPESSLALDCTAYQPLLPLLMTGFPGCYTVALPPAATAHSAYHLCRRTCCFPSCFASEFDMFWKPSHLPTHLQSQSFQSTA